MVRRRWPRAISASMTEIPPTKPPLPPLRERLKLPDNCIDVTEQHKGEVFVLTGYGTHAASRASFCSSSIQGGGKWRAAGIEQR
jgi:hypothetical protein